MALTTYGDIKTAVSTWLSRTDQTANIIDYIHTTHDKLYRSLRTREMETIASGVTVNAETAALPTNWLETRKIYVTSTSPRYELQYVSFDKLIEMNLAADTGIPRYYTVVGGNMQFAPIPDTSYLITHVFYQKDAQLSATADTNWILTNHPDLYLYGTLLEAVGLIQDDPRIALWQQRYDRAMAEVVRQSQRSKSGSNLQTRPG